MTRSTCHYLAPLLLLLTALAPPSQGQTVYYGEGITLGEGLAETWVEVDAEGIPLHIGMTLTESVLSSLPSSARVMSLDLPQIEGDDLFKHVMFDWNPHGHAPTIYDGYPHFDFHFFMLTEAERLGIPGGNDATPIPPEYMPEDHIPVPGLGTYSVAQMGVHYVDVEAPELNGKPFTKTFIYGFFDGEMIFVEPMITVDYLWGYPDDTLPVKQPEAYQKTGYYPTTYRIVYDAGREAFDVFLTDLVLREGTSTSSEDSEALPARTARLRAPYPNPSLGSVSVAFDLAAPSHVSLTVHDLLGREVARLVDGVRPAGEHTAVWNGRDERGRRLGAGAYLLRLRVGDDPLTRKVLLLH